MKFISHRIAQGKRYSENNKARRRGVAFIYLAISMLVLLGVTGLVVDIGHLHMKEAQAGRAADAAALAGAMQMPDEAAALAAAREYAAKNRYISGQNGTIVTGAVDSADSSRYTVHIERPEPLFFIRVLGNGPSQQVGATATAQYTSAVPVNIKLGSGVYGALGPINLSVYGPHSQYENGDPYSPRYLRDGSPNPYNVGFDGYNFQLSVPANYSTINNNKSIVDVEIFDPDTYNRNGSNWADGDNTVDEIRNPVAAPAPQPSSIYTQTRYSLYKVVDPNDPTKDQKIAEATYRDDASTDMKWVRPDGFSFDTSTYGTGNFRINVQTLDGSSENGFDLRAGPPRDLNTAFNKDNGTQITATGQIPINFNKNGVTDLTLGEVPKEAAGGDLIIEKFDTDIGSTTVFYTSDPPASNQPPGGWPGVLAANGQWKKDDPIRLPADYQTAVWHASYSAGQQDTSLWKMSYSATTAGRPGSVKLVGSAGKHF